ncbi:MAG: hypothetical protein ACOX35_08435 [Bacillota bacterium]|jgi:hypothetical protein|nr:hypothetical protein [Candidatus Fermentithermobacillaceae bacterium]
MWFVWALIAFAVLGWVGYTWVKTLITKYEHTTESVAILSVLFVIANYCGLRLTYVIIPVLSIWPRLLLMLPLGLLIFVALSYIAVNLWCAFLTRDFDEMITALEEEKDDLQRQLDIMRWKHITQGIPMDYPQDKSPSSGHPPDEMERLQQLVDGWQQAGSTARVRSIKVAEWKSQAENWPDDRLKDEIDLLSELVGEEADGTRKEQMKARLAVFQMELLSRESSREQKAEPRDRMPGEMGRQLGPEAVRRRLQDIHGEIQLLEAHRRDFLRGKVRLGWRVRQ